MGEGDNFEEGRRAGNYDPLPALPHFEEQKWGRGIILRKAGEQEITTPSLPSPILKSKNGGGKQFLLVKIWVFVNPA